MNESAYIIVLVALIGGALRVSTPFMFVALGECLTEKSGRVNLGLEGTLVLGAMTGYAISYNSGSPWLGVLAAGCAGSVLGAMHGYICKLPKVNDIAVGIAMMLFGTGVAFFFGKPYIQPSAPQLTSFSLGAWTGNKEIATGAADQSAADRRHPRRIGDGLGLCQHQMGPDHPHDRRQRACGKGHGRVGRSGALSLHHGGRLSGRRRRRISVAVLSRLMEPGLVLRSGPDGGGACHFRALEPDPLRDRRACCSAPPAPSVRPCNPSASPKAITSSMPRLTSSRSLS